MPADEVCRFTCPPLLTMLQLAPPVMVSEDVVLLLLVNWIKPVVEALTVGEAVKTDCESCPIAPDPVLSATDPDSDSRVMLPVLVM